MRPHKSVYMKATCSAEDFRYVSKRKLQITVCAPLPRAVPILACALPVVARSLTVPVRGAAGAMLVRPVFGRSHIIKEETMKMTLLAIVAASAVSLTLVSHASAIPVNGASIARIGQQIDPAINVATKKKSSQTAAKTCPGGQQLSTRTGKCRTPTSEEK
jgi:hypothetical protein